MRQLHLVGITSDHEGLIFAARRGAKSGGFIVTIDGTLLDEIESARRVRAGRSGRDLEPAQTRVESGLSPREMQARLRVGRTVSEVAAEAGVSIEWVERFAAPVLAEQTAAIARAGQLTLHTPRRGDSDRPLSQALVVNLADRGVRMPEDEMEAAWSAFQRTGDEWLVRFRYQHRGRELDAEWILRMAEGSLTAANRLATELGFVDPARHAPPVRDLPPARRVPPPAPSVAEIEPEVPSVAPARTRRAGPKKAVGRPATPRGGTTIRRARVTKRAPAKKAVVPKRAAAKRAPAVKAARTTKRVAARPTAKAAAKRTIATRTTTSATTRITSAASRQRGAKTAAAPKKAAPKRTAATKRAATKRATPAKRPAAKRTAPKRAAAKRPAAKRAATKAPASRPAVRKSAARKSAAPARRPASRVAKRAKRAPARASRRAAPAATRAGARRPLRASRLPGPALSPPATSAARSLPDLPSLLIQRAAAPAPAPRTEQSSPGARPYPSGAASPERRPPLPPAYAESTAAQTRRPLPGNGAGGDPRRAPTSEQPAARSAEPAPAPAPERATETRPAGPDEPVRINTRPPMRPGGDGPVSAPRHLAEREGRRTRRLRPLRATRIGPAVPPSNGLPSNGLSSDPGSTARGRRETPTDLGVHFSASSGGSLSDVSRPTIRAPRVAARPGLPPSGP